MENQGLFEGISQVEVIGSEYAEFLLPGEKRCFSGAAASRIMAFFLPTPVFHLGAGAGGWLYAYMVNCTFENRRTLTIEIDNEAETWRCGGGDRMMRPGFIEEIR